MKRRALLFVVLLLATGFAFAQTNPVLNNITDRLKDLSANRAVEKAYLHFDKPYYAAGDTVFFTAYVTSGDKHAPTNISGLLYADLITPWNTIARSIRLQVNNGVATGDFALADTVSSGNYRIRAYTNYMNNFGTDYYFDQTIPVGSVNRRGSVNYSAQVAKPDLQFFAEGGNLVANMENKVGFKAVGTNGLGINVKGAIVDNTGKEVAKFASVHLGMGTFLFRPEDGKTYKARLAYANGTQDMVDMPKAEAAGITLKVADTADRLSIDIRSNKAYYDQNQNKPIYLVIYGGGRAIKVPTRLDNRILSLDVQKSQFPSGVVQATLFSETGEPLSERLSFVRNHDELSLTLASDKPAYKKRDNVQLTIGAKDPSGAAAVGQFSIAVIDESKVPVNEDNEHTILDYLLLTSDLKGYIEQPNYYFIHDDATTHADLDALMLTQGYRKFEWKNLLGSTAPAFAYKPESALKIEGTVKTPNGQPAANEQVVLHSDISNNLLTQTTDLNGHFKFEGLVYLDNTNFIIQLASAKGNKGSYKISVDRTFIPSAVTVNSTPGLASDVNAPMMAYLDNSKRWLELQSPAAALGAKELKNVNVNGKNNYRSSSVAGPGNADQVINGDDIANATSMAEGLSGRIRGAYVLGDYVYLRTSQVVTAGNMVAEPMLIVIDGVQQQSIGINSVLPSEVETVEILKGANAVIYGVAGGAGVIVVTTRVDKKSAVREMKNGSVQYTPQGFYKARDFYVPKYTVQAANQKPDLRSTIFWAPNVITDKNGQATLNFTNADGTGAYRVVIEGIDTQGNIGRQVYRYKVQ